MAPRGKKSSPPKKDGCQAESLADTPPLKGKPPVTKPHLKKKSLAGEAEGLPPSPASGTPPSSQPPSSYAAAARTSMDTSEPMDIEQLCAMQPQRSGTPPRRNHGPPPSAAAANLSQTHLPDQGPPLQQSLRTPRPHCPPPQLLPGRRCCRCSIDCRQPCQDYQCCWPPSSCSSSWLAQIPPLYSEGSTTPATTADFC